MEVSSLKNLLRVSGLLHFCQLFAAPFVESSLLKWKEEFAKLSPVNVWTFKVMMMGIMIYAVGAGVVVVWAAEEIAKGGRLAAAFSGFLCVTWIYRGLIQILLYSRIWPGGWKARSFHYFLCLLCAFLAVVYGIAWVSGISFHFADDPYLLRAQAGGEI